MFKDILKSEMERLNYTAPELAIKLNLYNKKGEPNKQRIYDYLKGAEPPFDILLKLAAIFNVSTDYLLGNTTHKTKVDDVYSNLELPDNIKETYIDITTFINNIFNSKIEANDFNALYSLCDFIAWLSFFPKGLDPNEYWDSCDNATEDFKKMWLHHIEEHTKLNKSDNGYSKKIEALEDLDFFGFLFEDNNFFKMQYRKMSDDVYNSFFGGNDNVTE